MREILGSEANGHSFAGMLNLTIEKGYLDQRLEAHIIELKNYRRDAKHRGQGISEAKMDEILPSILSATHQLTRLVRE
jgi:hypothetical protein